jgi:hypothetical protein
MFGYSNNDSAYTNICIFIIIGSHAEGLKITNVLLILKVCDVIFCMLAKQIIGDFEQASTLEKPIEITDSVFFPFKK